MKKSKTQSEPIGATLEVPKGFVDLVNSIKERQNLMTEYNTASCYARCAGNTEKAEIAHNKATQAHIEMMELEKQFHAICAETSPPENGKNVVRFGWLISKLTSDCVVSEVKLKKIKNN